jgi:two-component system, cell cycle sensor histidine kinase and response regulator CckA
MGDCQSIYRDKTILRKETILVVDDAEAIRKMVCAVLLQHGYGCVEASDGNEALRMLNDAAVQLVLTDVLMPGMGGAELASRLAQEQPGMRIMFMSGYSDHPVVRNVQRAPGLFLAKPFTTGVLMSKIRQVLDQPWKGLK